MFPLTKRSYDSTVLTGTVLFRSSSTANCIDIVRTSEDDFPRVVKVPILSFKSLLSASLPRNKPKSECGSKPTIQSCLGMSRQRTNSWQICFGTYWVPLNRVFRNPLLLSKLNDDVAQRGPQFRTLSVRWIN